MTIIIFLTFLASAPTTAGTGADLYKACIRCHGEFGEGKVSEKAPQIAGQFDWYIKKALSDFKSGARKNPTMFPYVKNLTQDNFNDLATYVSQLKVK